jgi:hypothetical protein
MVIYQNAQLGAGAQNDPAMVRPLQADLRALGYLYRGIDGVFGSGTSLAVSRLQYDLLHNNGASTGTDGNAPVAMTNYAGAVTAVTGVVDQATANAIAALLAEPLFPKLPNSPTPEAANQAAIAGISAQPGQVPVPFMLAIFQQESGCQHFAVPETAGDTDSYVVIGLDTNAGTHVAVTSRGYGIGQYTLFHHPPSAAEQAAYITDPITNMQAAFTEMEAKFSGYVTGPSDTADDHQAEHGGRPLTRCQYAPGDARYLKDCKTCATAAGLETITAQTPVYAGAAFNYSPASAYPAANYPGVPIRAGFLCDWPYAVRRYNGSGPNSYNYQAIILKNLLNGP